MSAEKHHQLTSVEKTLHITTQKIALTKVGRENHSQCHLKNSIDRCQVKNIINKHC